MSSQVVTKRRVKRRQQRQRLVSKNAKRKVRSSVRKHRKTAKKVMRGGGPIWSQSFSVVDKSPGKDLIKRDNVFTLSVSKPMFGKLTDKKFNIELVFDLDQYPDIKTFVIDFKGYHKTRSYDESINLIIIKLIEHICGSEKYSSDLFEFLQTQLDFPSKDMAKKADENNSSVKSDIGRMSVSKNFMDTFITKDGKVRRPCTINMSLRIKDKEMSLFLDDYTKITKQKLYEFEVGARLVDWIENRDRGDTYHIVYEWKQREIKHKIAVLDTIFTEETLKTKLNELKDETDQEYRFYQLIHNIKKEETNVANIEKDATNQQEFEPRKKYENITIKFINGDTFTGTFEISKNQGTVILLLIEGKYTWSDGTVYEGTYNRRELYDNFFKYEGAYTWPDTTTYEGYFKVDYKDARFPPKYIQDKLWTFDFNSGILTKVDAAQVAPAETQPIETSQVK